jgi:hypothetical protein
MAFVLRFTHRGQSDYDSLKEQAEAVRAGREARGRGKSSKAEGLFKQVNKALRLLRDNPKHPGLHTHEYDSLEHPWDAKQKVWEAYAQNNTPGAYRIFWCYGPEKGQLTVIAITTHP